VTQAARCLGDFSVRLRSAGVPIFDEHPASALESACERLQESCVLDEVGDFIDVVKSRSHSPPFNLCLANCYGGADFNGDRLAKVS